MIDVAPYRSTVHFVEFVRRHIERDPLTIGLFSSRSDNDLHYMASCFPRAQMMVREGDETRIAAIRVAIASDLGARMQLLEGDWIVAKTSSRQEGVVSLYTLSEHESPAPLLEKMCEAADEWAAASVLAWPGDWDFVIHAVPVGSGPRVYYNVYSFATLRRLFIENGMSEVSIEPFEIDVDIQRPASARLGTYTQRTVDGGRLQVSGPLLMPWCFVFAKRF